MSEQQSTSRSKNQVCDMNHMKKSCSPIFLENDSHNTLGEHSNARESFPPRRDLSDCGRPRNHFQGEQIQFLLGVDRGRTPPQNSSAAENS